MRNDRLGLRWRWGGVLVAAMMTWVGVAPSHAQSAGGTAGNAANRPTAAAADERAAQQALKKAQDLLDAGETQRGLKALEDIVQQYPAGLIRLQAMLAMGRHYTKSNEPAQALNALRMIRSLEQGADRSVPDNARDIYLEGLYLMGVAHCQLRQYNAAFPLLRRITDDFPTSTWANGAYYHIGMAHVAQENWSKAIEALQMVGACLDPSSPAAETAEAGLRFHVKIVDQDLKVFAAPQGSAPANAPAPVTVSAVTKSGDRETIPCYPQPGNPETFVGSIATALGPAKPGDNTLQVVGGDQITTIYIDSETQDGKRNLERKSVTRVVSTAALNTTLGDLQTQTVSAFLEQPLFVVLNDADLDLTPKNDTAQVRVISRYRKEDPANTDDPNDPSNFEIRDQVALPLNETGTAPVHTGQFVGRVEVRPVVADQPVDKNDQILQAVVGDQIIVNYTDEVNQLGPSAREVTQRVTVVNPIESRPRITQYTVNDPITAAEKNIVEASALLELARIFRSMGLTKGAKERSDEGLARIEPLIRQGKKLPPHLIEKGFQIKWELQLAQNDLNGAVATCELFGRLFPQSPLVDQALMGVAQVRMRDKKYEDAINIYRRILNMPQSASKAEAQFRLAEATEISINSRMAASQRNDPNQPKLTVPEQAIVQYKIVAERYRDSEFAGPSLAKIVDYYIETKNYTQANDMLTQVFQDFPDASFLDAMLLKWVRVAYFMGDYRKALDKCNQLLSDYPDSSLARSARTILPQIEQRLKRSTPRPASTPGGT